MHAPSYAKSRLVLDRLIRFARIIPLLALAMPHLVSAQSAKHAPEHDRVRFSVSVEQQVESDRLIGRVAAQAEAASAADAAEEVNQMSAWAMAEAAKHSDVVAHTAAYRTSPIYRKQHIEGWRVRQTISLRSADGAALSELLAKLQTRLHLEQVRYELSPERLAEVESALLGKAIAAFKQRASTIAKHMERPGYTLIEMNINGHRQGPRPVRPMVSGAMMKAERSAVAAPVINADTQTVTANISGTIELAPASR